MTASEPIDPRVRLAISQWPDDAPRGAVQVRAALDASGLKAITAHGVPQRRLLPDNGVALNPSRRGFLGQLVHHVSSLGVEAVTGKPYKPRDPHRPHPACARG